MSVLSWNRSLRLRLLGPQVAAAVLAALAVTGASYWWGSQRATTEIRTRFDAIERTLADASYPLNALVLDSLAQLTQTELVTLDATGRVQHSTVSLASPPGQPHVQTTDARRFLSFGFNTVAAPVRPDGVYSVRVLFDEAVVAARRRQAAMWPLVTGLSTILALTSITLLLTSRLVGRIAILQQRVEAVAGGDFDVRVPDQGQDELGRLGLAVQNMAGQLRQLWKGLERQQNEKVLHQVAGGMAHQLRNSLTGARLAVELHAAQCRDATDEDLQVAIGQIEQSEDYVRRLLLVAAGRQDPERPMRVEQCWQDLRSSLAPVAEHLKRQLHWELDGAVADARLVDGPSWTAAVSNLVHNALQAADDVQVRASADQAQASADQAQASADQAQASAGSPDAVCVRVIDNGPGIPEPVAEELFEPFVTSKPEGMGLGLSIVHRTAQRLGGSVRWYREGDRTVFQFTVPLQRTAAS
ncbi:sensor histidine kinase [Roseimaritima sediminicola]|uniref:sensor histidine kinase n=1 Tax=Roseimaritima sediminicola TaxID=2662066 RepID=UPI001F328B6A|nr:HAMP domain-containing sensor histidine kinase [Roseimaritima sediminicola]